MPWLDAAWHPAGWIEGPVPFDATDRGLLLADGVFDTSLVLGGRMVWRTAHLARLTAHARALGFGVDPRRLDAAVEGTLATLRGGHGTLRLTLTRGPGRRGLAPPAVPHPTLLATLAPLPPTLLRPLTLHPTAIRRNETSPLAYAKTLGYADAVMAVGEARAAGCDDALFLNVAGRVACAGAGNLFAQFGRELATPPLADGVLDGVTRAVLLEKAATIGLTAVERYLAPGDLDVADAVICTSSLRLVGRVTAIGPRQLSADAEQVAALATLIAEAIHRDAGFDPRCLVITA